MRTRNHEIHLRLNDQEYQALMKNAVKCNMSQQSYLRQLCRNVQPKEAPSADFAEFTREVRKIGTNINQIAAVAHRNGAVNRKAYNENYMQLVDELNRLHMEIYFPELVAEKTTKTKEDTE